MKHLICTQLSPYKLLRIGERQDIGPKMSLGALYPRGGQIYGVLSYRLFFHQSLSSHVLGLSLRPHSLAPRAWRYA